VFALEAPCVIIGRDSGVDVHMTEDTVSLRHALVTHGTHGVQIEDQGSRGGTFVNGQRIAGVRPLLDGDRIRVGTSNILKFSMMDELEQRALTTLSELTLLDPLTRLYNRRYFDRRLHSELAFATRHGMQMAVLMIDVDHFKRVNDTHGHQAGDRVLTEIAGRLSAIARPQDLLARVGGEEIAWLMGDTGMTGAHAAAERGRRRVGDDPFAGIGTVTISGGVCDLRRAPAAGGIMRGADLALYQAKERGRDAIVRATSTRGPAGAGVTPAGSSS
jgi:diguanylate cyclase (GGDEF)-like protein